MGSDITSVPWIDDGQTEDQFGYRRQAVSVDAKLGTLGGYQAARGNFDAAAITAGMQAGPLAGLAQPTEVDGVQVMRWLQDKKTDYKLRASLTPLGRSGRLAIADDSILLLAETDGLIANMIATQRGRAPSLADDPAMRSVATVMDDHQALSGYIESHEAGRTPIVLQYSIAGCGSYEDGGLHLILAFATDSEADANGLADELRTLMTGSVPGGDLQWGDVLADAQFTASGSTAVVTAAYSRGPLECNALLHAIDSGAGES